MTYILGYKYTNINKGLYLLVTQIIKIPPAVQETQVQSLGQEDPLEKGMATHSSILAWKIPWREEPRRLQSTGLQRFEPDWADTTEKLSYLHKLLLWPEKKFSAMYK